MIIAVTGGRDYVPRDNDAIAFVGLLHAHRVKVVRHGGCRGADAAAARAAKVYFAETGLGGEVEEWPADWKKHGKAAGPIRNRAMLQGVEMLIALPGGRGTADCIRAAREAGITVIDLATKDQP
jgi:hypothetical protein